MRTLRPLAQIAVLSAGSVVAASCGGTAQTTRGPTVSAAVKHFKIGYTPVAAFGARGKLWVGDQLRDAVYEIAPGSGMTIRKQKVDSDPYASINAMALSGSRLWVAYGTADGDSVRPVDVRSGALGRPRRSAHDTAVAAGATPGAVYVGGSSTITRIGAAGGRPLIYNIPHSDPAHNGTTELIALAATPTIVWAALRNYYVHNTTLMSYDPRTLRPEQSINLADVSGLGDFYVTSLLVSGGSLWAASVEGPVLRIRAGRVTDTVDFSNSTSSLLADPRGVWVVEARDGKVDHISSASGKVDETIAFAPAKRGLDPVNTPRTLSEFPGQLWVTDYKTGSGYRITLPPGR